MTWPNLITKWMKRIKVTNGHIAIISAMATMRSRLREGRILISSTHPSLLCFLPTKALNEMTEVPRPVRCGGQATPQHLYLWTIAGIRVIPEHLMPTVRVSCSLRRQFLGCRWTRSGIRYGLSWGGLAGPHLFLQLYIYIQVSLVYCSCSWNTC